MNRICVFQQEGLIFSPVTSATSPAAGPPRDRRGNA